MNSLQVSEFSNRVFDRYDKNRSGYIEKEELNTLLYNLAMELNSQQPTKKEIDYILSYLDSNKDSKVSKTEFQRLGELMVKVLGNK